MHPDFDLPSKGRIDGRITSITAAFFQAITPVRPPTDSEVDEVLGLLGMQQGQCRCAYCGDKRTEWDHFRPIVKDRKPTGYITEIANLVPACGKCNQSKGNKDWKDWIKSNAALSPSRRAVPGLADKIARLEVFEAWSKPTRIDYAGVIGETRWRDYLQLLDTAVGHLTLAQKAALELRAIADLQLANASGSKLAN